MITNILPGFLITFREALEAALIIGIFIFRTCMENPEVKNGS
ncbi:hypothetical protein ig2599ANME_1791 [groundwater metagenome]